MNNEGVEMSCNVRQLVKVVGWQMNYEIYTSTFNPCMLHSCIQNC